MWPQEKETKKWIKVPIFLEADLAIEICKRPNPIYKRSYNLGSLKYDFSSRADPSIFTSIEPVLLDHSNKTSWFFAEFKSTNYFLAQSIVFCRSNSSSEASSSCCLWYLFTLRIESSTINIDRNIADNFIKRVMNV